MIKDGIDAIAILFQTKKMGSVPASVGKKIICLYEAYSADCISILLPQMILAKAISDMTGFPVVQVAYRKNRRVAAIARQFGFKRIYRKSLCSFGNREKAIRKNNVKKIIEEYSIEELLKFQYKGCNIGEKIYDTLVRNNGQVTIKKLDFNSDYNIIYDALACVDEFQYLFNEHSPVALIIPETVYEPYGCAQTAYNCGAWTVRFEDMFISTVAPNESDDLFYPQEYFRKSLAEFSEKFDDQSAKNYTDKYLKEISGGEGRTIFSSLVYNNKVYMNKSEFYKNYNLDYKKPTVVIMAHCMTDAPHSYTWTMYKDYYTWLQETMKKIGKIHDVNWIIKPHPHRVIYEGEIDVVESMWKQYCPSATLYEDHLSPILLSEIADCLITVGGTAGIEYALRGIPTIICANPWYSGNGFTIEPKTEDEYYGLLRKIKNIKKLSDEQIKTARRLFAGYLYRNDIEHSFDDLDSMCRRGYDIQNRIRSGENNLPKEAKYAISMWLWYECHNDVKKSFYYTKGIEIAEKVKR